jgi:hypothetical protein
MLFGGTWSLVTFSAIFPQIAQIGMIVATQTRRSSLYSH